MIQEIRYLGKALESVTLTKDRSELIKETKFLHLPFYDGQGADELSKTSNEAHGLELSDALHY
jgi:hypothetical protein